MANEIGDLRYDALAEFLHLLSEKLASDSKEHREEGRVKLAAKLTSCAAALEGAARETDAAWVVCAPFEEDAGTDEVPRPENYVGLSGFAK